ncbi:uncharacterized protein [Nicotiana tomentosiformis]|uniref:uncharacterized protein n=1 Tax=Nicotiana tomentosiformis TaxID=4098 RepID=UPI00388CD360
MHSMNSVFQPYLDSFIILFIDDFLVYSHIQKEHAQHLRIVLRRLREEKLYANFSKYEFWLGSVAFLGHVVSSEGIQMDSNKIEVVKSCPRPSSATEIRSFLGLASYYHGFVEGFSSIASPLTKLTQKGAPFRQKDLNLRQWRWLEIIKDYDITILYHPGKPNVVADALSRRAESLGSLAYLPVAERPLALDVQALAFQLVKLDISEPSRVLAYVFSRSSRYDRIRERQYDDPHLLVLQDRVRRDRGTQFTLQFWRAMQRELGTQVELSTTFHPQMDGQSERTIHVLEDMLRACVIVFGGSLDRFLPLAEFAYNNNYQSSIQMALYEALYRRRCRYPVG